jgi:hypothetical protein
MAKDPWNEYSDLTIRLGWLERELTSAATSAEDKIELADEIERVSACRDDLVARLSETTSEVLLRRQPSADKEPLLIGF